MIMRGAILVSVLGPEAIESPQQGNKKKTDARAKAPTNLIIVSLRVKITPVTPSKCRQQASLGRPERIDLWSNRWPPKRRSALRFCWAEFVLFFFPFFCFCFCLRNDLLNPPPKKNASCVIVKKTSVSF